MDVLAPVLLALVALGASAGLWLRLRGRHRRRPKALAARVACPPQRYDTAPAAASYVLLDRRDRISDVHPSSTRLRDQPEAWRSRMRRWGEQLRSAGVGEVTFVHGTFVGTDPFSFLGALQTLSPRLDAKITARLGVLLKSASDSLTRDRGNFHRGYVELFRDAVGIPSSLFVWSSENTHAARLRAAAQLAHHLNDKLDALPDPDPPRILLVGHSHAGQVFALLLQMLADCQHAPELLRIAAELGEDPDWLALHLERLRREQIDVVTLGTPVRYGWPSRYRPRLLHIVNHRGVEPRAGRIDGVPTTRDGDYIQQWGIAGSDLLAPSAPQRNINRGLDEVLGPGYAPRHWIEQLEHRKRVHDGGTTLLVDFGDASPSLTPNCIQTNFGHAVYTRRMNLELWLEETARRLY